MIDFVPSVDVCGAVSFSELLPPAGFVIEAGVKLAVAPAGNPVTERLKAPENPPDTAVVIGTCTLPFRGSDTVDGAVTVNPLTASVTIAVGAGDTPPPAPVTVIE